MGSFCWSTLWYRRRGNPRAGSVHAVTGTELRGGPTRSIKGAHGRPHWGGGPAETMLKQEPVLLLSGEKECAPGERNPWTEIIKSQLFTARKGSWSTWGQDPLQDTAHKQPNPLDTHRTLARNSTLHVICITHKNVKLGQRKKKGAMPFFFKSWFTILKICKIHYP